MYFSRPCASTRDEYNSIIVATKTAGQLQTQDINEPGNCRLIARLLFKVRSILGQDMNEKRAQYIQRNNELMQEFAFVDCVTKTKINSIYNSHSHVSVLWYLFGLDTERIYKTWNTSIRKMFRLDRTSHRHFIEPVSNVPHTKISLIKRFINFIEKLNKNMRSKHIPYHETRLQK